MEQEIWKVIDGYNGAYRVSNKGNFESCINMGNHKIDGIWRRKKFIAQYTLDGKFIKEFYSLREIERTYPNVNRSRVRDCAKGLINSVCGYKWKFINKK